MRTFVITTLLAVGGVAFLAVNARSTQDPHEGFTPEMLAEMMKLAGPGPEHEVLGKYAGEWDFEVSMTMMPGMPAMTGKGTGSAKSILGGRFLQLETSGQFMGQPTETMSILGFDRRLEQWTAVGFDTLGTYWVSGQGKKEEDGVIRLHGTDPDPMGEQVYFFVPDWISDDEFTWGVHFSRLGEQRFDPPHQMVSVHYTRKK